MVRYFSYSRSADQLIKNRKDNELKSLILDAGEYSTGLAILDLDTRTAKIVKYIKMSGNYKLSRLEEKLLNSSIDGIPLVPQVLRHDPLINKKKAEKASGKKKKAKKSPGNKKQADGKEEAVSSGMTTEACRLILNKIAHDNGIRFFLIGLSVNQTAVPLDRKDFKAVVSLMQDLDHDGKLSLRSFSAIDEKDSTIETEQLLMEKYPQWFSFEEFKARHNELSRGYRDDTVFRSEYFTLKKGLIDSFSAVTFAERFMRNREKNDYPDATDVLKNKAIERFFENLGY